MSSSANPFEPLYVVDIHALIWYLTNDKKLGNVATQVFAAAERGETLLILSVIVVAEMYYANQKYGWFSSFRDIYSQLTAMPFLRLVALEPDHILDFDSDVAVSEMHDRVIVGLARRLSAPLMTADRQIQQASNTQIVW